MAAWATMCELAGYDKSQYRMRMSEPADSRKVLLSVIPRYSPLAVWLDAYKSEIIKYDMFVVSFSYYVLIRARVIIPQRN